MRAEVDLESQGKWCGNPLECIWSLCSFLICIFKSLSTGNSCLTEIGWEMHSDPRVTRLIKPSLCTQYCVLVATIKTADLGDFNNVCVYFSHI